MGEVNRVGSRGRSSIGKNDKSHEEGEMSWVMRAGETPGGKQSR